MFNIYVQIVYETETGVQFMLAFAPKRVRKRIMIDRSRHWKMNWAIELTMVMKSTNVYPIYQSRFLLYLYYRSWLPNLTWKLDKSIITHGALQNRSEEKFCEVKKSNDVLF